MKIIKNREKEFIIKEKYGYVKNIIHSRTANFHVIGVGKTVMWDKNWKTFPDFLMNYIKFVLGKE